MNILLVEDDLELSQALAELLGGAGHTVVQAADGAQALAALTEAAVDLVISDVRLPDTDGATVLRTATKLAPPPDFIMMTAFGEASEAVAALKQGASDYLVKPFDGDELLHHVRRIASAREMRRELVEAKRLLTRGVKSRLVGTSAQMQKVAARIEALAPSDASVLIVGESGTGKELVAREIHARSPRAERPFVAVNCAAFPDTLIEAELFGYERGAFTGAERSREGRFRAADGGTLFLDEIGELSPYAQAKLLRVLQEGQVEPLGSDTPVRVDVRLVCATHRNLRQRVADGTFREDLFYRIDVLDVSLPALRERGDDRELLIQFFLSEQAQKSGDDPGRVPRISGDAYAALSAYSFPGNVRELAHAIEHAAVLSGGEEITLDHLPASVADAWCEGPRSPLERRARPSDGGPIQPLSTALREFEKNHLQEALAAMGGKKVKTAAALGISRKSLWEKLRMYEAEATP